jgi:hypothetical protein
MMWPQKMSKSGTSGSNSVRVRSGPFVIVVLMCGAAALGSCASTVSTVSEIPASVGGLPAGAPARPATPAAYPAVHDIPRARGTVVLTEAEKKKLEADLAAAREQQARRAAKTGVD